MRTTRAAAALLVLATASAARGEESASSTTISGKTFLDYTYRHNVDGATGLAGEGNGTSIDLKRFYLTVDHAFDRKFNVRFRTDAGNLTNGKFDVFVKHAYVQATFAPELVLRAGSADLPWVPFVEDAYYGLRYVEAVLADRVKLSTSADWGLHASGKLAGGLAAYAVSVVNGRGYGDPTRTQAPTVEGRVSVEPVKGLAVALGAEVGKLGQNVTGQHTPRTARRFDAFAAWMRGGLRVGALAFVAKDYDKAIVLGTSPQDTAQGASAWASYAIGKAAVFGRADAVKPKVHTSPGERDLFLDAGLQYEPVPALDVALVYKRDQVRSGVLGTLNGNIGTTVAGRTGTYDEVGVFAQYSF